MEAQLFIQAMILLGCLFSGLFNAFYAIKDKWYQNYTDFEACTGLPASLIMCEVAFLAVIICLIGLNIYKCICKAITNTKVTASFTCGALIFILYTVGSLIYATYVYFNKICYDHYIASYPHLWLCLEVLLVTIAITISLAIAGGIGICSYNVHTKKREKKKIAAIVAENNALNMV